MTSRFVNLSLLFVTAALVASGVILFTTSRPEDAWLYAFHRFAGAALVVLLIPKTRIVYRSLARRWRNHRLLDLTTIAGVGLTGLIILTLALALAWTLDWLPFYLDVLLRTTPLGLHWYLGLALVPFFAWHAWKRWVPIAIVRKSSYGAITRPLVSRRTALNMIGVSVIGFLGVGVLDFLADSTDLARRFTGSRLVDSFQGNQLPVTNSDLPPAIDVRNWRLRISGRVANPLELSYADLLSSPAATRQATLDCTLGWASSQIWRGASIAELLRLAGSLPDASRVSCLAATGTAAELSIEEARTALIATHIGDEVLDNDHGFPARLVAPTRRGYHWIKWMSELVVS